MYLSQKLHANSRFAHLRAISDLFFYTPCIKERGGPGELRSYWEVVICQIVHQTSNETSVFEVIPEIREGKTISLHRSMFFSLRGKTQDDITPISASQKTRSKMKQKPNEEHWEAKLSKHCVNRNTRKYNLRRARSTTM